MSDNKSENKKNAKKKLDNAINKVSQTEESFLTSDRALTVLSILLGIILWATISVAQYPDIDRKFDGIPIKIEMDGSEAQAIGLDVVEMSDTTVTADLKAARTEIGSLKPENLVAVPKDLDQVKSARPYDLILIIKTADGKEMTTTSIYPSSVKVTFDKMVSKEIEVTPVIDHLRTATGYISGDVDINPKTIWVSGPEKVVNSITKAEVKLTLGQPLTKSYEGRSSDLVLYNGNTVISNENKQLSFDKSDFELNIPVYFKQTLPLNVNIINAPSNLDLDYFRSQMVFSLDEIVLASFDPNLQSLESLDIGTIDMREADVGKVFEFSTEDFLPEDVENLSNVDTVTVTMPSKNITKKPIAIRGKDIQFVNRPADFEISTVASGITIYLIGDEEQISEISNDDVTAQVDMINFDHLEGDHRVSVDFIISSKYNKVWFIGPEGQGLPKIYATATKVTDLSDLNGENTSEETQN